MLNSPRMRLERRGVQQLCTKYGADTVCEVMQEFIAYSERRMRCSDSEGARRRLLRLKTRSMTDGVTDYAVCRSRSGSK